LLSNLNSYDQWVKQAVAEGAQLIYGGEPVSATCYPATVPLDPPDTSTISQNEVFGPVICVNSCSDTFQAMQCANALPFSFQATGFDASGDSDGLAWNVVVSGVDIWPGHSVGINYGHTGTGWLLSPQYLPNSELYELRYQWQSERWPLLEARMRWQEDMEKPASALQKQGEFDFYLRLTWEFEGSPAWLHLYCNQDEDPERKKK
jgi:hypothetical protein